MADTDFGFVPSGEGVGPGFGDMSFSTEPENSSFEVSGDGFGFGTANTDAWFVQGPGEDPGFETDREKKKKKKKSKQSKEKDESHGSPDGMQPEGSGQNNGALDLPGELSGYDFPVSSARRVSFSQDPPESRTFGTFGNDFADKVASVASAAASPWENSRDEVFEASQAEAADAKTQRFSEHCSQCRRAFELTDSIYCRHCGCKRSGRAMPRSARSLLGLETGFDRASAGFGERFDEPKPMERKFSFSLSDLPDSQLRVAGPASHYGIHGGRESLDMQKWNPLDGIRRHWSPTDVEFQQLVGSSATAALAAHGHPASLQMLGSLNEAQKAEVRAKEMRKKISQLEASLGGHSTAGHVAITAPNCHDGLGIILNDLTVSHVTDPLAKQAGWAVGDSILKVNGTTILHANQLSTELAKAMSASRAVGRPMLIDVWRHPENVPSPGNSLLNPPVAPSRSYLNYQGKVPEAYHGKVPGAYHGRNGTGSFLPPQPPAPTEPVTSQHQAWTGPKMVSPAPQSWTGPHQVSSDGPDAPPNSCVIA
eukprot:s2112_g28.t1